MHQILPFFASSTVCAKTRRKIEKTERRNENTVYSEKLRLTRKQRQRRGTVEPRVSVAQPWGSAIRIRIMTATALTAFR